MHEAIAFAAAVATQPPGRDALDWFGDIAGAVSSLVVVVGGIAATRYLRRANLQLTSYELSAGRGGWLILRATAQLENKGFLKLSFEDFTDDDRPSITVAEAVDVPRQDGTGREIQELRTWVEYDLDSDVVDPGELSSWTEVFYLDPPSAATVGYRVTVRVPVKPSVWARLVRRGHTELWEDQTFLALNTADTPRVA